MHQRLSERAQQRIDESRGVNSFAHLSTSVSDSEWRLWLPLPPARLRELVRQSPSAAWL